MSATPHTDRLADALELARSKAVDGIVPITIELFAKMVDEIGTLREMKAAQRRLIMIDPAKVSDGWGLDHAALLAEGHRQYAAMSQRSSQEAQS